MENTPIDSEHNNLKLVSASGLDERQIAPEDITSLNALFRCDVVSLDIDCHICALNIATVQPRLVSNAYVVGLCIPEPRPLRIKIEPLPKKVRVKRMKLKPPRIRAKAKLAHSLAQPIRRRKLRFDMLSEKQQENMSKELFKKFGDDAQSMYLVAAYAHIPPESAQTIRIDSNQRYATFTPNQRGRKRRDYYLLILERKDGRTEKVLVRL